MYEDENCVFVITVNKCFNRCFIDKKKSISYYFKLYDEKYNKEVRHFKITKEVYGKYKKTFNYEILVKNSIIG